MTIEVIETENGFSISWDPDDPIECVFNDWTEDDFTRVILARAEEVIAEHENAKKSSDGNTFEQEFMAK